MTVASAWAATAVVHVHPLAPWKAPITVDPATCRLITVGNITFLPPPIAGYRIRHVAAGVIVEIKPSHAPATELARCIDADAARAILDVIGTSHTRPFLGEIGRLA